MFTINEDGIHSVTYYAKDNAGNIEAEHSLMIKIDKTPPELQLSASPNELWPPNHKMVNVTISGMASDSVSGVASTVFTVQDEYGSVQPSIIAFNSNIPLEAWREGADKDGRVYTITAVATDEAGNQATASTTVLVPHDKR